MLLLKSFPLSISILWRFLLVLPLWTIFYTLLTVLSVFGVFQLLGAIPIVGLVLLLVLPLITMAITYTISMHPYLIGIGIGLRVLGHKTESSQGRLISAAIGYGLVEAIVAYAFLVAMTAVSLFILTNVFDAAAAFAVDSIPDPMTTLSTQIALGTATVLSVINSVVVMGLRAALLPVLASVSAGRNPDGLPHRAFDGFGALFLQMILLLLMITALSTIIIPFAGDAAEYIGLTSILTGQLSGIVLFALGEQQMDFTLAHAILVVLAIVISIWLFCLQCAGAALSYDMRRAQRDEPAPTNSKPAETGFEDLAALRRSRMPQHRKQPQARFRCNPQAQGRGRR